MEIYLIRHGKTEGNEKKRYIGSTDQHLSETGRRELTEALWKGGYGGAGLKKPMSVYVSRLFRTKETAEILFPGVELAVRDGFNECDFGEFENKAYEELVGNPAYRKWIESGGVLAPPGGEAKQDFVKRTVQAFEEAVSELLMKHASCGAFAVHGGSIMAVLEHFSFPKESFYHWQAKNGCGYRAELSEEQWKAGERKLTDIRSIP